MFRVLNLGGVVGLVRLIEVSCIKVFILSAFSLSGKRTGNGTKTTKVQGMEERGGYVYYKECFWYLNPSCVGSFK